MQAGEPHTTTEYGLSRTHLPIFSPAAANGDLLPPPELGPIMRAILQVSSTWAERARTGAWHGCVGARPNRYVEVRVTTPAYEVLIPHRSVARTSLCHQI